MFLHDRPVIDYGHDIGPARTGIFIGFDAAEISLDDPDSPVFGPSFPGNSSTGGVFYSGDSFPPKYKNTYFHGDFGALWIKNFVFDENDNPIAVEDFLDDGGGIIAMATHPIDGSLYFIIWSVAVNKISYIGSGNKPPNAVIVYDRNFDSDGSPVIVQFTGSLSSDPEGGALTYQWDFGDSSPINNEANPVHEFSAPIGVPTRYDVSLTVTDDGGSTSLPATAIVSVNNTPPTVNITSPVDGSLYSMAGNSTYDLTADIDDIEHGPGELSCRWLTALHHNNHKHDEPFDPNCSTSATISPAGCDGNTYFYKHTLTVTDAAGLSTPQEVSVYPDCSGSMPPTLSIHDVSIVESDATATFTVVLTPVSGQGVNVDYTTVSGTATAGADFETTSGSLTFAPGETDQTLSITVYEDALGEGAEEFSVELSGAINAIVADAIGIGTIIDNDIVVCGEPGYDKSTDREVFLWKDCATEVWHARFTAGGGYAQYRGSVDSNLPLIGVTPVSIETNDTFDYTSDPNSISYYLQLVPPYEDGFDFSHIDGADVCFAMDLSASALVLIGPLRTPVVTPFDLETLGPCVTTIQPILRIADTTVVEGNGATTVTVSLIPTSSQAVTVDYSTASVSATAGEDFSEASGTLAFAAGETSKTFSVTILDDAISEGDEVFDTNLTNPGNAVIGVGGATVTIIDDEVSACGTPSYNKNIDRAAFVWRDCTSGVWRFRFTAGGGFNRYVGSIESNQPFSSALPVSQESGDIFDTSDPTVIVYDLRMSPPYEDGFDVSYTPGASVCFGIDTPAGASVLLGASRTPVSVPLDLATLGPCGTTSQPTLSIADVALPESAGVANFTVSLLPASSEAVTVNYMTLDTSATSGLDYEPAAGTLLISAGETSGQIAVTLYDDALQEGNESFILRLSGEINAILGDASATGTIIDDEVMVCGAPSYNQSTDRAVFLWKNCSSGTWHARYTAAGGFTRYIGSVDSDQALISVVPLSIEASDVLDYTTDPTTITYRLKVSPPYFDGDDLSYPAGADVCFGLTAPAGAQVMVGPDRTPVVLPFNLETLGPC